MQVSKQRWANRPGIYILPAWIVNTINQLVIRLRNNMLTKSTNPHRKSTNPHCKSTNPHRKSY